LPPREVKGDILLLLGDPAAITLHLAVHGCLQGICDDTYSNKSRYIVGQNLYMLKEVNQIERDMGSYLEWLLHCEAPELEAST
jgi:hypothetical protein